jgi:hypothetical protein
MNKSQLTGIIIVGMTLGTAWAVRGQFGHEQGAAWAGGIGGMALILASRRTDWYKKVLPVAFVSAIGWGVTGMISYGQVVGYGRSNNFPNAFYGLLMLFVIGSLFGLLGGGLTGLALETDKNKRVRWGSLMAEMVAGAVISYGLLVEQLGVLMTPPRAEHWAFCLGGGLAMLWHMARKRHRNSMRIALLTALGAGFGFAFGNFLQTVGTIMEIRFNMWNVMEYSIGFFGGTSMAYAVFTSSWPVSEKYHRRWQYLVPLFFLAAFIPLIVFRESIQYVHLLNRLANAPNPEQVAELTSWVAAIILSAGLIAAWLTFGRYLREGRMMILYLFAGYFAVYIIMSYLVTGAMAGIFHLNHHLYVVNLVVVLILLYKNNSPFTAQAAGISYTRYRLLLLGVLLFIALLALVSVSLHEGMPGAHDRFPV